jgi:hypothetical protein
MRSGENTLRSTLANRSQSDWLSNTEHSAQPRHMNEVIAKRLGISAGA